MTDGLPKPCEVERDSVWWPGLVRVWRRDGEHWRALVSYSTAPGMQYLHWVPQERVRQPARPPA